MYQVLIERSAEKDLKKISAEERPKLADAMRTLCDNPRPTGCRKLVGFLAVAVVVLFGARLEHDS